MDIFPMLAVEQLPFLCTMLKKMQITLQKHSNCMNFNSQKTKTSVILVVSSIQVKPRFITKPTWAIISTNSSEGLGNLKLMSHLGLNGLVIMSIYSMHLYVQSRFHTSLHRHIPIKDFISHFPSNL